MLRSNQFWKIPQNYVTKITLDLGQECALDVRQEST